MLFFYIYNHFKVDIFFSRGKINFTLDSEDDSASDREWSSKKNPNKFISATKKKKAKADDEVTKGRVLPKRKASQQKITSFLEEDEDDDDFWKHPSLVSLNSRLPSVKSNQWY